MNPFYSKGLESKLFGYVDASYLQTLTKLDLKQGIYLPMIVWQYHRDQSSK